MHASRRDSPYLLVGTFLSLFDNPIMHTYVDDLARWSSEYGPGTTTPGTMKVEGADQGR